MHIQVKMPAFRAVVFGSLLCVFIFLFSVLGLKPGLGLGFWLLAVGCWLLVIADCDCTMHDAKMGGFLRPVSRSLVLCVVR